MNKNDTTKLEKAQQNLKLEFNNLELLKKAFIHRSYLNETKEENLSHNERLEFLGDAVLELLVTEHLFHKYPQRPEGDLTSFRSATVKTESLAETAMQIGLGEYIYMSKGEEATGGRTRPYILANTFEALLGAIYLDKGYESAQKFLEEFLFPKIQVIVEKRLDIDGKSKLQELSQEITSFTPIYELIDESGPDHDKTFTMSVQIGNNSFGQGTGKSKQEAEQNAAANALNEWDNLIKKYF